MTASLIVSALCLLLVGTLVGVRAVRAARERHWLGGTIRGLVALLLLALAALAATLTVGLHGYRALSFEEVAATVRTEPVAPQRFRATITLPDHRLAMYELAGDAFYMDAHILKWHPWANLLGLHTVYELDRVAGRYNAVADERTQPHTAYELGLSKPVDLYSIARRRLLGPLVDAEYGSATFVAATRPTTFEVRLSRRSDPVLLLKLIQSLFKALHSEGTPGQLAAGLGLGSILGLTPLWNLHNAVVLALIIVLNVSFAGAMLGWALFVPVGFLLDPAFDWIGRTLLLDTPALRPLWTALYNAPVVPLTSFNNTIVLGSLVVAAALWVPLFFASRWGVVRYRATVAERVKRSALYRSVVASKLYNLYRLFRPES